LVALFQCDFCFLWGPWLKRMLGSGSLIAVGYKG
jgi:hypothetical protein